MLTTIFFVMHETAEYDEEEKKTQRENIVIRMAHCWWLKTMAK